MNKQTFLILQFILGLAVLFFVSSEQKSIGLGVALAALVLTLMIIGIVTNAGEKKKAP